MDSEEVDEDSIDAEALQAQIDLSMSFAQSLVSSWLEPQKFPPSSRNRDLEEELTDYMKRPPRLGVGASILEGHKNTSREAARLKGKLSGSKRPHENDSDTAMGDKRVSDDDEGESRAGSIKKKARPDPFDGLLNVKKKKKHHEIDKPPQQQDKPKFSSFAPASYQKIVTTNSQTYSSLNGDSGLKPSSSKKMTPALTQEKETHSQPLEPLIAVPLTPSKEKEDGKSSVAITPRSPQPSDHKNDSHLPKSPSSGIVLPRNSLQSDLLKRPILNLSGPPPSDDEIGAEAGTTVTGLPTSSPKKKRKRRKKKKKLLGTDAPSGTLNMSPAVS